MANLARPMSIATLGPGWEAHQEVELPPEPEPPAFTGNASPSSAPVSGGSTHMIAGTGLVGITRVTLSVTSGGGWSADANDFEVVSENQLWFEAPEYTGVTTPPVAAFVVGHHPLGPAQRANALVYMAGEVEEPEEPAE